MPTGIIGSDVRLKIQDLSKFWNFRVNRKNPPRSLYTTKSSSASVNAALEKREENRISGRVERIRFWFEASQSRCCQIRK